MASIEQCAASAPPLMSSPCSAPPWRSHTQPIQEFFPTASPRPPNIRKKNDGDELSQKPTPISDQRFDRRGCGQCAVRGTCQRCVTRTQRADSGWNSLSRPAPHAIAGRRQALAAALARELQVQAAPLHLNQHQHCRPQPARPRRLVAGCQGYRRRRAAEGGVAARDGRSWRLTGILAGRSTAGAGVATGCVVGGVLGVLGGSASVCVRDRRVDGRVGVLGDRWRRPREDCIR